ncbi:hypothetical protein NHX12_033651 [Muraenolepis orangiensis]|uniref:Uncharacterized protein n=1 Tax=Muraenolepis orangiensis TaxID=630683 RepID=A0A9Q0IIZ7_9TELE|nr:hypothetical protein NHX12_033651 [Muraenolepis orangiensis]
MRSGRGPGLDQEEAQDEVKTRPGRGPGRGPGGGQDEAQDEVRTRPRMRKEMLGDSRDQREKPYAQCFVEGGGGVMNGELLALCCLFSQSGAPGR